VQGVGSPGDGSQTVPSSAPVIGKSVEAEIRVLETELAKARENGDASAVCRYAETLANIKAKSAAMSCQMDATLRKIFMAGVPLPIQPGGGSVTPIAAASDQMGADHEIADEGHDEGHGEPDDDGDDSDSDDGSEDLTEGDSGADGDHPDEGDEDDGEV